MRAGDFVLLGDVLGCVRSRKPLRILCQDGVEREFQGTPVEVISGQQYALLLAEKAMRRIKSEHS